MYINKDIEKEVERLVELPHPITLKFFSDENDQYYFVQIPMLRGCNSTGKTIKEALEGIVEAKKGCISIALEYGDPIPEPDNTKPIIEIQKPYTSLEIKSMYEGIERMAQLVKEVDKKYENVIFLYND